MDVYHLLVQDFKHCPCVLYLLLPMMELSVFQVQLFKLSKNEEKRWMKFVSLKVLSRFSHIQFFVTLWTAACQASLSVGFSRQENWNGLPFPPPGGLPDPGIKLLFLTSPISQADSLLLSHRGRTFTISSPWVNLNFPQ